jgi:hypothetical protein
MVVFLAIPAEFHRTHLAVLDQHQHPAPSPSALVSYGTSTSFPSPPCGRGHMAGYWRVSNPSIPHVLRHGEVARGHAGVISMPVGVDDSVRTNAA